MTFTQRVGAFLGASSILISQTRAAIPLDIGTTYSGSISLPGETPIYTFAGTPGRRLYLDTQDADNLLINLTLTSPAGAQIFQRNDDYDYGPFVLTEAGPYSLVVNGTGSTTGNYQFRVLDLAAAPTLTLGGTLSGQLSPALACNIYQFNGKRGQRVNLQSLSSSSNLAQWQLVSPANVVLASGYIYQNLGVVTLPIDGPYCLMVMGYSQGAPAIAPLSFQVMLSDVSDSSVAASGFGTAHSGTVNANQTNSFSCTASAGLPVYFDSLDSSGQSLVVTLTDPAGNTVFYVNETSDSGPYILPRSGTYTLNVWGPNGTSGNFNFRLLDLTASPPLPTNTLISNSVNSPYETDVYQFTGTAGQRLYYDTLLNVFANVQFRLLGPDGQTPFSLYQSYDAGPFSLSYNGTYYFFVQNGLSTSITYTFELFDVATQPPLPLNAPLTGNLAANASALYQLTGTNGERLFFNGENVSAGGASWSLYDPKNAYVSGGNSSLGGDFEVSLPYSGNYVLVLSGGASSLTFSNYVSTYAYQTNSISFATPVSNNIVNPGDQVVYTFNGTAGHKLYFDSLFPSSSIYFTLYSPTGLQTAYGNASSDVGPFSLTETGTYTLIFNASGDSTGPLSFQLLDINTQPVVPLNVDFTGILQTNTAFIYQLAGTNGEQLYFHGKGPAMSGAYWALYDPRNAQIGGAYLGGDFYSPLTLPFTGNYTLVFSAGVYPASYSNQVNTFIYVTNSLTLGTPATNNIFNPGDQVFYTFTGTAGQRVYYGSLFPSYLSMYVTLISPTGISVNYGNAAYDLGPVTLLENGTYTLQFNGSGNAIGGIYFRVLDVGTQPALPLNTDLSGTLSSNSSTLYQLAGTAGEQLYFNSEGVFTGSATWILYAPNNAQVGSAYLGSDFELTLPYSGNYLLAFVGGASDVIYTNQVNTFGYTTNTLSLGTPFISTILKPGNQLYYTFTGNAGQRLYYDSHVTNYVNAYLNLVSPSGLNTSLGNPSADKGPFTLTQSGTYTLVFDGLSDATGIIAFSLLDLAAATPITVGATVSDSLSDETQTRLYRFAGTAGQRLNLQSLTSPSTEAVWTLIGLADQNLGSYPYISGDIGIVTLPATGTYTIAVIGNALKTSSFNYQFTLSDVSDTTVSTTGLGVVVSGNIVANQTNTFTFTAPAGLPIFFDSQDTSGQSLLVDVISPDSTLFVRVGETADAGPYLLPRSGTYTVNVWANGGASGNYSFRLLDLSTSQVLPLNTPFTGTLTNSYETDIYRFTSSAGQQLIYNALTNDINYPSVYVQLLDPRGQTVGPNSDFANSSGAPFTIQYAGTSYLFLRNNQSVAATYSFQMLDIAAQPSLPLNISLTNNLGAYALEIYKLSGNAGQQLYLRGFSVNPSGYWSLFDPNNSTVSGAGANLYGDFEVTLPVNGTYALMLVNSSGSSGAEVFQVNDFSYFTNTYTMGSTVVDAIGRPGERRFYTFNGTVGQQLYYDALTNSTQYPGINATLLNPAGIPEGPINGGFWADRGPFTLQNSGTYTLVFDGYSSSVGPIAFRLLDIASQAVLPINSWVTNNLDVYPSIVYRYAGTFGQQLYFRGQPNNPNGYWTIYDPNNYQLYGSGANLSGDFEVTLPMNGTYTLVLYNNTTTAGLEIFQVNDFAYFTNSYTIGTAVVDSINRPGERRAYTFTGTVGQKLYFDALTNAPPYPNNISAVLLNPQGVAEGPIGGGFYADRGPFTLQQSGSYTLVMDGNGSGVGPIAFRLLDVSAQSALPLNTLTTNSLDLYAANIYRYLGTSGQQLYFRGQSSNPNGSWTLYDPNDYQAPGGGASLYGDFQVMLPIDGLYTLVFVNNGSAVGSEIFEVNPFNFGETLQVNRAPVLAFVPDQITGEGTTPLLFTAHAIDPDGNTLSFTLDPGAPGGASINATTGLFSWTPPPTGFSFVTNVTVRVTDNGTPPLSVAQTVSISVVAGPVMITVQKTTTSATVYWRSAPGKHYQLAYKNSLEDANWTQVGSVLAAADFISSQVDNTIGNNGIRYYRVQLLDPAP
jgi:hypothetical protein